MFFGIFLGIPSEHLPHYFRASAQNLFRDSFLNSSSIASRDILGSLQKISPDFLQGLFFRVPLGISSESPTKLPPEILPGISSGISHGFLPWLVPALLLEFLLGFFLRFLQGLIHLFLKGLLQCYALKGISPEISISILFDN